MDKNESKHMQNIVLGNLLHHFLSSIQKNLKTVTENTKDLKFTKHDRTKIEKEINNLRTVTPYLTANKKARTILYERIELLRNQLNEPDEFPEYTHDCINNLQKAIDYAIIHCFGDKEDIIDLAIISTLRNIGKLDVKALIPAQFLDLAEQIEEGD